MNQSIKQPDPFSGMTAFVKAAQLQSFSKAARQLGQTPSAVSKAITRLEKDLDVTLFNRSPRLVTLTQSGELFYQHCSDLLSTAQNARAIVTGQNESGFGHLRVCLPISFGQLIVANALHKWQTRHPNITLDVVLTDRQVDMVQESYDLAIRFDHITDSRLIAKTLPTPNFITCATESYFEMHGKPNTPADLNEHNCLGYIDRQTNNSRPWIYKKDGKSVHIQPSGNVKSDQGSFLLNHALASGGIIHAPEYLVKQQINSNQLTPVFTEYETLGPTWWVIYPYNKHPSTKLIEFRDFIVELLN